MEFVTIKGKGNEIELCLAQNVPLEQIEEELQETVRNNLGFFVQSDVNITYSGGEFDYFGEVRFEKLIKHIFGKKAKLVRKHRLTNEEIRHTLDDNERICKIVRRSLRSGDCEKSRGDIIVYGDVNPGAEVMAKGNITVLGTLRGVAQITGRGSVFALSMQPTQIRIGNIYSYSRENDDLGAAVAKIEKGKIVLQCLK